LGKTGRCPYVRMTTEQFEQLVDEALAGVPPEFRRYLDGVAVEIEDEPDERTVKDFGPRSRRDLLGLYRGRPLTDRSTSDSGTWPDSIVIYQRNIERMSRTRGEMRQQVRKTILHEIGHHFGLDEDELDRLGYG
jgi:predicted Zn-dependent protease with MMP-like domain